MIVKLCGLVREADVDAAVALGADALGFNLWPGSKRHVPLAAARLLATRVPPRVRKVGVFVDAPEAEVRAAVEEGTLDVAQLHGDEPPALVERLVAALGPARVWKAVRLDGPAAVDGLDRWAGAYVLVDAAAAPGQYGGTGRPAERSLAFAAARRRAVILAGGLTPETVAAAILAVRPAGVDVAGGIESAPGIKDAARMDAFLRAARAVPPQSLAPEAPRS